MLQCAAQKSLELEKIVRARFAYKCTTIQPKNNNVTMIVVCILADGLSSFFLLFLIFDTLFVSQFLHRRKGDQSSVLRFAKALREASEPESTVNLLTAIQHFSTC